MPGKNLCGSAPEGEPDGSEFDEKRRQYAVMVYLYRSFDVSAQNQSCVDFSFWRNMETKIALVAIIVENLDAAARINEILHQYGSYIIGRMGVPHRERGVSIISVAMDAPADVISALSGKLGNIPGVTSKTIVSKAGSHG